MPPAWRHFFEERRTGDREKGHRAPGKVAKSKSSIWPEPSPAEPGITLPKAKLPHSPVDCMNASLDAFQALQRDGAGRPKGTGNSEQQGRCPHRPTLPMSGKQEKVGAMPSSPDSPNIRETANSRGDALIARRSRCPGNSDRSSPTADGNAFRRAHPAPA